MFVETVNHWGGPRLADTQADRFLKKSPFAILRLARSSLTLSCAATLKTVSRDISLKQVHSQVSVIAETR